jgi:hypothetical protein
VVVDEKSAARLCQRTRLDADQLAGREVRLQRELLRQREECNNRG